jgi:DNA-binding transcriptional MerR regulator
VYGADTLALLSFVRQAQRLGFSLDEIKEIVAIRRAGHAPCPDVRDLVRRKTEDLDRRLTDLMEVRDGLRALVKGWRSSGQGRAAVCPHIERGNRRKGR